MAQLDTAGQSWVTSLASYNFMLHYRRGKSNVDADILSRIPWDKSEMATLVPSAIKAIAGSCLLQTNSLSIAEAYVNPLAINELLATGVVETLNKFTNKKWKAAQRADEVIAQELRYLQMEPDT